MNIETLKSDDDMFLRNPGAQQYYQYLLKDILDPVPIPAY